jgi:hypothetical protein
MTRRLIPVAAIFFLITAGGRYLQAQSFTCSSDDGKRHYCDVNTSGGVRMVKQRSGSPCIEGQTWGYDRRGIWVDRGCRADFVTSGGRQNSGYRPPYSGGGSVQNVTCSSEDGRRHYCDVDTSRGVRMVRQRSGSPCTEGSTWGYDRRGVWVDRGCRADFVTGDGRPAPGYRPPYGGGGSVQNVTCASEDGKRHYCNADTSRGVRMVRQRSGSPCTEGSTWGYDSRGIWVDRGCRADFTIGGRR